MRAAHSLKGAARIVGLASASSVAHAMEDCFVAAQRGALTLAAARRSTCCCGADLLTRIAHTPEAELGEWSDGRRLEIDVFLAALRDTVAAARLAGAPAVPAPATHAAFPLRLRKPRPRRCRSQQRSRARPTHRPGRPSRPASRTARSATACSASRPRT